MTGDLILCYGWNWVAVGQNLVRNASRIGTISTLGVVQGIKQWRGDAVPPFAGTSKANHALVVGLDYDQERDDGTLVQVSDIGFFEQMTLDTFGGRMVLEFKGPGQVKRRADITDTIEQHGGLEKVSGGGSAAYGGRKIVVEKDPDRNKRGKVSISFKAPRTEHLPRLCHSTGGGCVWTEAMPYFDSHGGSFAVFRLKAGANAGILPTEAGRVATAWASTKAHEANRRGDQYGTWKAIKSAFGSHIYGPSAKKRAEGYRKHKTRIGGPPSKNVLFGGENTYKDWFCSMFVIACYQGATADDNAVEKFIALDARHTSPMTLDGFLRSSDKWQLVATRGL